MKEFILLIAVLLMALPASAETLNFQVTDNLTIDAEAPDPPEMLPSIQVKYLEFDVEQLQKMFMKVETRREDDAKDTMLGDTEGDGEYMLIERDAGRFCYTSEYVQLYFEALIDFDEEMTDNSYLFPDDLELSGFPRAQAVAGVRKLLQGLGIRLMPGERVYTLEKDSYAGMQVLLSQSEAQTRMSKRYLEPFDPAHEGYYMVFEQELYGMPCDALGYRFPVEILLTRQGYEYVDTGYAVAEVSRSEALPVMPAGEALEAVAGSLRHTFKPALGENGGLKKLPVTIERVRLVYEPDNTGGQEAASTTYIPVWKYTYLSSMQQHKGTWRERALDNGAAVRTLHVDARLGTALAEDQPE